MFFLMRSFKNQKPDQPRPTKPIKMKINKLNIKKWLVKVGQGWSGLVGVGWAKYRLVGLKWVKLLWINVVGLVGRVGQEIYTH
jgi:hypothetical protein